MWNESTCRQVKRLIVHGDRPPFDLIRPTTVEMTRSRSGRLPSRGRGGGGEEVYIEGSEYALRDHVDNTVSHLNSDRVSVPSIGKDLLGMREDRERGERFAISTTIRTTSSTQSKRFVYRRGDLGKTDVYLGQRDRRWNAASGSRAYSFFWNIENLEVGYLVWIGDRLLRKERENRRVIRIIRFMINLHENFFLSRRND